MSAETGIHSFITSRCNCFKGLRLHQSISRILDWQKKYLRKSCAKKTVWYWVSVQTKHFSVCQWSNKLYCSWPGCYCYIPVHTIVNLYIFIPYLFVYLLCVFVLSLSFCSFCHENKFPVCVKIPGNKAHSDSDSEWTDPYAPNACPGWVSSWL